MSTETTHRNDIEDKPGPSPTHLWGVAVGLPANMTARAELHSPRAVSIALHSFDHSGAGTKTTNKDASPVTYKRPSLGINNPRTPKSCMRALRRVYV